MFSPTEYRDVPPTDLLSYVFEHRTPDESASIYLDAADASNALSYSHCRSLVRRLIAGLKHLGVGRGDSVAVHAYNSIYYAPLFLAIVGIGGVYVGSNPAYTESELVHLFTIAEVKFIFTESELLDRILSASCERNISRSNIVLFDTASASKPRPPPDIENSANSASDITPWRSLLDHGEQDWVSFTSESDSRSTPAALLQTSGTTGLPKAASLSHYAFVAQSVMIQDRNPKPYTVRRLLHLPSFHAFALPLAIVAPLLERIPTYVMRRYDPRLFFDSVQKYEITESHMVNPIALATLAAPPEDRRKLGSLRQVWIAGAPLGEDLQYRLAQALHPEARVVQVLGMTECGWITTFHYPEKDLSGSCGRLMPNVEAKIVDLDGQEITHDDQKGEIWFRSVSRMSGYKGNETATKDMLVESGWIKSGDIGYVKDGKWWVVDRAKDMIKVRGWQVSPAELEAVLLSNPRVRDAAVLGIDLDDGRGELPRAYIVTDKPDSDGTKQITDEEILGFMGERLARYKALAGGIRRVASIPRGPSGKILKNKLREAAKKETVNETLENGTNGTAQPQSTKRGATVLDDGENGDLPSKRRAKSGSQNTTQCSDGT